MKKNISLLAIASMLALLGIENAQAAIANPNPDKWKDDTGATYFLPEETNFAIEALDLGGYAGLTEFGFYFQGNDPTIGGNRIPVFRANDQRTQGGVTQLALIFHGQSGLVLDLDNDYQVESLFTGTGPIGFYYSLATSTFSARYYSDAAFNTGGLDLFSAFESLMVPDLHMLVFESPTGPPLTYDVVSGLSPVPVPTTLLLFGSGVVGLLANARRRK